MSNAPAPAGDLMVIGRGLWLGEELAANTLGVAVHSDPGLFLPTHRPLDGERAPAWWMPCSYAALLLHTGVKVQLSAPGPFWLAEIDPVLTGRPVYLADAGQLRSGDVRIPGSGAFVKLAEAKDDSFPSRWRSPSELNEDMIAAGLPESSWIHWSPVRLDLSCEYRCHVVDHTVVTSSLYLRTEDDGGQTTYYDGARIDFGEHSDAVAFARSAVESLSPGVVLLPWVAPDHVAGEKTQPDAYVLDVGYDRVQDRWVVIEANPAWSSAWYGADIDAVVTTISRSCHDDELFGYVPDPLYVRQAQQHGPLR